MILLDTDVVTLLGVGHSGIRQRVEQSAEPLATTVITRVEILRGRFDSLLKAADGTQLQLAMSRLGQSEADLSQFIILPIDETSSAEFDRLLRIKKLRKIGRGDLLIASLALAHKATLVTRNLRDFGQVPNLRVEDWTT